MMIVSRKGGILWDRLLSRNPMFGWLVLLKVFRQGRAIKPWKKEHGLSMYVFFFTSEVAGPCFPLNKTA